MNNCIILGSGRSGTSMVAGVLAKAGYFMGDQLYPANPMNPKGMFEDGMINGCNEELLTQILPETPADQINDMRHARQGQRWLCLLRPDEQPIATTTSTATIQELTRRQPFCFKDPRFSYTLPVWRPYLADPVFLCVFRDPSSTIRSILRQITKAAHLKTFTMSAADACTVWTAMYQRILAQHCQTGTWLFLHYEQVLTDAGLKRISALTGAMVDQAFPETALRTAFPDDSITIPAETRAVYQELCRKADFQKNL